MLVLKKTDIERMQTGEDVIETHQMSLAHAGLLKLLCRDSRCNGLEDITLCDLMTNVPSFLLVNQFDDTSIILPQLHGVVIQGRNTISP